MQENAHTRTLSPWIVSGISLVVGIIVLLDEIAKWHIIQKLPINGEFFEWSFFTIGLHKNFGIAFDIPFTPVATISVSAILGILLLKIILKHFSCTPLISLAAIMIVLGASGNLYDRIAYGFTVDYLLFFDTSALNISDFIIVSGALLLIFASRTKKSIDK
ncbi:MAG: Lipoprotein signal peptidase [Candidatus Uhrbacteria bacterium GW2011_GWE2_46_68]|uniref:Lipoprotein signal peptidase n=2 Tax=Candidatus Uhriibacteriota TaxID=1752732 RepID=A0A0G1Q9N5_9BACT|nr:MAG: Lipoprotein signal peptidase [Candidatus Uhrbacteria bacterium GW2011_GWF2_46_218]KKU41532.1 MAG: Lipoprotein signal peptidase [Candidatus Uhrbacteria bacterium GW2011_GWE2_46_68]